MTFQVNKTIPLALRLKGIVWAPVSLRTPFLLTRSVVIGQLVEVFLLTELCPKKCLLTSPLIFTGSRYPLNKYKYIGFHTKCQILKSSHTCLNQNKKKTHNSCPIYYNVLSLKSSLQIHLVCGCSGVFRNLFIWNGSSHFGLIFS